MDIKKSELESDSGVDDKSFPAESKLTDYFIRVKINPTFPDSIKEMVPIYMITRDVHVLIDSVHKIMTILNLDNQVNNAYEVY